MSEPVEPRGEPWPFDWPANEHCHWHDAHEPIPSDGAHAVCFECGHVYATRAELEQAYTEGAPPGDTYGVPEHIAFCPYCIHDF